MDNEVATEQLLQQLIAKTDNLSNKFDNFTTVMTAVQVDVANTRGEISSRLLQQAQTYDTKLIELERRFMEKHDKNVERIGEVDKKVSGISVKLGFVLSGVTIFVSGLFAAVFKYVFHS